MQYLQSQFHAQSLNVCDSILNSRNESITADNIFNNKIFSIAFSNIGTEQTTLQPRLSLLEKIIKRGGGGNSAGAELIKNIIDRNFLSGATIEERLKLYDMLLNLGTLSVVGVLTSNIKKLGLEDATFQQRLQLFGKIAKRGYGYKTDSNLFNNFSSSELQEMTLKECLDLCYGDYKELIKNIKNLGFNVERTLQLCREITQTSPETVNELLHNFKELGLEQATPKQLLDFSLIIAERSSEKTKLIIDKINTLGSTPQERLELYKHLLAKQGEEAACELVNYFNYLGLEQSTPEQLCDFGVLIAEQGQEAAQHLLKNLNKFDLGKITQKEHFKLYQAIAMQGQYACTSLFQKLINEDLGKMTVEENFQLCKALARLGGVQAAVLARRLDKIKLSETSSDEQGYSITKNYQLELIREILNQGDLAASALSKNPKLKDVLSNEELFSCLGYATVKGLQHYFIGSPMFKNLDPVIKRQVLIDLLSPPSGLKGPVDPSYQSHDLAPILTILNKEPNQLNEKEIEDFKTFIVNHPNLKTIFEPIIKEIETQKGVIKTGLFRWAAYAAGVLSDLNADQIQAFAETGVLTHILSYQNMPLRYTFVRAFSHLMQNPNPTGIFYPEWKKLTFLLAPLTGFGLSLEEEEDLRTQINETRCLRDTKISTTLAQLLLIIGLNGPYEADTASHIAQRIIKTLEKPETPEKKPENALAAREGEEKEDQGTKTTSQPQKADLTQKELTALTNILLMFGKEEFIRFITTPKANATSYFQDNFKKFFTVGEMKDFESRYETTFGKFRDPMALFTYLRAIERLPSHEKTAVKGTLGIYVDSVLNGTFKDVRYAPKNSPHLQQIFSTRPHLIDSWRKSMSPQNISSKTTEADAKEKGEQSNTRYRIVETDDPCDLLLIGTEVKGSCQSISGDPNSNKALLSFLMNGEVKAIAVKQGDKVVARVLMRLMWDDQNNKPVLLQEPLYSNVDDPTIKQAINDAVLEKAKAMGICLVSKNYTEGEEKIASNEIEKRVAYNGTVTCLKGFAPFNYSDLGGGLKDAAFAIADCYVLYDPTAVVIHPT